MLCKSKPPPKKMDKNEFCLDSALLCLFLFRQVEIFWSKETFDITCATDKLLKKLISTTVLMSVYTDGTQKRTGATRSIRGIKVWFLSINRALSRNKTYQFFLSIQNTLQFSFSVTKIFYYKQNYSPLIHAKKFIEINNKCKRPK